MPALLIRPSDDMAIRQIGMVIYGSPGCIAGDTFIHYLVRTKEGRNQNCKGGTLAYLYRRFNKLERSGQGSYQRTSTVDSEFYVQSVTDDGKVFMNKITNVVYSGKKTVFLLTTASGRTIKATADHEFMVDNGYLPLASLSSGQNVYIHDRKVKKTGRAKPIQRPEFFVKYHPAGKEKIVNGCRYYRVRRSVAAYEAKLNGMTLESYRDVLNTCSRETIDDLKTLDKGLQIHHKDENCLNDAPDNLMAVTPSEHIAEHHRDNSLKQIAYRVLADQVVSIEQVGVEETYDIVVADPYRNFVANGIAVHNCGKTSITQTGIRPFTMDFDKGAHRSFNRKFVLQFASWSDVIEFTDDSTLLLTKQPVPNRYAKADDQAKYVEGLAEFNASQEIVLDTLGGALDALKVHIRATVPKAGNPSGGLSPQGWGVLADTFITWVNVLKARGKDFVGVAHEKEKGDNQKVQPAVQGGSYNEIHRSCDLMAMVYMEGTNRFLDFTPSSTQTGKDAAKFGKVAVPALENDPHFLGNLLKTAKERIGKTAEASAAKAKIDDEIIAWQDWEVESLEAFQQYVDSEMPRVKTEHGTPGLTKVWAAVQAKAATKGWVFDKTTKKFAVKS